MEEEMPKWEVLEILRRKFGWEEYTIFAVVLVISAGIGAFFGFSRKENETNEDYLVGGRKMGAVPVALSLFCSFVSAITVLGNPVETYLYGSQYMTVALSFIPMSLALHYLYVPVYFNLKLTSAFEYLEKRFNPAVRILLSVITCFYLLFYMALVVYGPAISINQVTGFNTLLAVLLIFVVCIFYSSVGGFKAVIWTDAFQAIMMVVSLAIVVIKGVFDVGGMSEIWNKAKKTDRIEFFRFDPDPRTRHTVWSTVFGGYFLYLTLFGATQANIQRYCSMPNLKTVKRSIIINYLALSVAIILATFAGLVIFTRYFHCDPIHSELVEANDQILPLFMMDSLANVSCLPGIFVGGLTCASLSTVSSGLNALAAIVTEDFVKKWKDKITDKQMFRISRLVTLISGVLSFAFVFVARNMGDIFPAAISLIGMLLGPTLGIFTLGMMFPWANSDGALYGIIASYIVTIFIGVGSSVEGASGNLPDQRMSLSTERCYDNGTLADYVDHAMVPGNSWKEDAPDNVYIWFMSISYMWFPMIGCMSTILFGLIISCVSSCLRWNEDGPVNVRCLSQPILSIWKFLFPNQMDRLVNFDDYYDENETKTGQTDKTRTVSVSSVTIVSFAASLPDRTPMGLENSSRNQANEASLKITLSSQL